MIPIPAIIAAGKALFGTAITFLTTQAPVIIKTGVTALSKNAVSLINLGQFIPKTASILKTKEINKQLFNLVGNFSKVSKPFEKLGVDILDNYSNTIKNTINNFSSENKLPNFLSHSLELKTNSLKREITDLYEKEIGNIFSLNNESLLNILEKNTGLNKETSLKEFALESVEKTHNKLILELKEHSKNQQELIKSELHILNNSKLKESENLEREFESIRKCYEDEVAMKNKINNLNNVLYKLEKL